MNWTDEQKKDRASVWEEIRKRFPRFTPAHDAVDNWHVVREIVLGGSIPWHRFHELYEPRPGHRVMDVGANVGIFSAYAALKGAAVTAYEPFPVAYALLDKMVKETGLLPSIETWPLAIWTLVGQTEFQGNSNSLLGPFPSHNGGLETAGIPWVDEDHKTSDKIACVPLERALGLQPWDCVKMDIEGAEYEVILACPEEALRRIRFMFVELHPWISDFLYQRTLEKVQKVFERVEVVCPTENGRHEALFCSRML